MADLAAIADVANVWREIDPDDAATLRRVDMLITAASAMVRQHVPGVDSRMTAGNLAPELVAYVVAEMVARKMRNPDGASSISTGPFSRSFAGPHGLLLTPEDLNTLSEPDAGEAPTVYGSVRLGAGLGYAPAAPIRGRHWL
jgi:hypothetical protein